MANKEITLNDYKERINKVVQYIHTHLDEKLDIDKLAHLSCFSPFHFHRIMRANLNESLISYIIRLRLETAANMILHADYSITDIAYKVGYDVPSSFNKAFKKRFGVSPTNFKDNFSQINHIQNSIHLNSKIAMELKPKIKELKPKKVIYVNSIGAYEGEGTEEAWNKVCEFAKRKKLFGWKNEFIGISHDDPKVTESSKLRYDACVSVTKDIKPEGEVGVKTIEGGKYAIFMHRGPYERFQETYNYIFGVWLSEGDVELRDQPCFEKYLNGPDKAKPENLKTEIYIPIQ